MKCQPRLDIKLAFSIQGVSERTQQIVTAPTAKAGYTTSKAFF